MEAIVHSVQNLDQSDLSTLERLVGHQLRASEKLVIQVLPAQADRSTAPQPVMDKLPDWCHVYEGLTDAEIDELDRAIVRDRSSRDVA
jgi:hypothetical protein